MAWQGKKLEKDLRPHCLRHFWSFISCNCCLFLYFFPSPSNSIIHTLLFSPAMAHRYPPEALNTPERLKVMHYGAFVPVVREKKSPGNQGEHVKSCMPCVCRYTDLRSVLIEVKPARACGSIWLQRREERKEGKCVLASKVSSLSDNHGKKAIVVHLMKCICLLGTV